MKYYGKDVPVGVMKILSLPSDDPNITRTIYFKGNLETLVLDGVMPEGVVKIIHHYSPEWPDDPSIRKTIHVMADGEERVVFSSAPEQS